MVEGVTDVTQGTSTTQANSTNSSSTSSTNSTLGKNDFMNLLIAQMKNQDPMNPMDNQQFVAQLATFSSLEQLMSINAAVTKLAGIL